MSTNGSNGNIDEDEFRFADDIELSHIEDIVDIEDKDIEAAGFSAPATPASLLLACLVDETVFLPTRSGNYPALVGARFETPAPLDGREVTFRVAVMVEVHETGPVRVEFAVLSAQNELMVNAFSDLFLEAGQHLNVTPVRALFDTAGKYILGVAVNGQRSFFPLEVVPEPVKAKTEAKP